MSSIYCEKVDCGGSVTCRCCKCDALNLPICRDFGWFCCRACQMSCYKQHDELHKVIDSLMHKRSTENIFIDTLAVAIKEASCKYLLPRSLSKGVFSLLLVGCEDYVEGSADYYKLYERLNDLEVFASGEMYSLEVTLSGPKLTSRAPFYHPSGRLTVLRLCGRVQRLFPKNVAASLPTQGPASSSYVDENFSSTTAKVSTSHYGSFNAWNGAPALAPSRSLAAKYCCAVMRNPGLYEGPAASPSNAARSEAPLAEQWEPAIQVLLDSGLLVFVVNICEQEPIAGLSLPLMDTPQSKQQHQQLFSPTVSPSSWPSRKSDTVNQSAYSVGQDEQTLDERYHARFAISYTPLPRPCLNSSGGGGNIDCRSYPQSCMYLAFQGRRSDGVNQQIAFFLYMAKHNHALRQVCLQMASEVGTGKLEFPVELTQTQLEQEAIARNLAVNPLRPRLLEHDLLEQMRVKDRQCSPAVSDPQRNLNNYSSDSSANCDDHMSIPVFQLSPAASSERRRTVRFAEHTVQEASPDPVQPSSTTTSAPACAALTFKRF